MRTSRTRRFPPGFATRLALGLALLAASHAPAAGLAAVDAARESAPAEPRSEAAAAAPAGSTRALVDLEGEVVALGTGTAEGDLPVVTVALATEAGEREVSLAPESVLAEAGFVVAEGDRVRARVFLDPGDGPAAAQKVMNLSRDLLLRLRTFSRAPIWDAQGRWEGSRTEAPDAGRRQRRPTRRPQPPPERRPAPPPPARPPPA